MTRRDPPPLPLPPGVPASPLATWGVAAVSSGVLEAVSFGVLNPGVAQRIVALVGFVGPLVISVCDAIIRHGHSRVTAAHISTLQTLPRQPDSGT